MTNKTDSCITYVSGKAYDLSNFEHKHPGGVDLIRLSYDTDATAMIHSYHKDPEKIFKILASFDIDSDMTPTCPIKFQSDFLTVLKKRIDNYFETSGKNRRGGLLIRTAALSFATLLFYYLALDISWLFSPFFGVCLACIGLCIHHDANHGAYSRLPAVNHFVGLTGDLIGSSSLIWRYYHCQSHHVNCNDVMQDEDTKVGLPLFRLHSSQPRYGYMKFQHLYTFLLYALIGIAAPFSSMFEFIKRKHGDVKLNTISTKNRIEFWVMKLIYFGYMFFIPFYLFFQNYFY